MPVEEAEKTNKAAQENSNLSLVEKQTSEMSYRALVRQQDRYNQILEACSDKDAEKELKFQNQRLAKKAVDDKNAEKKAQAKIADKKRIEKAVSVAIEQQSKLNSSVEKQKRNTVAASDYEKVKEEALSKLATKD